jgi:hypothetical protein
VSIPGGIRIQEVQPAIQIAFLAEPPGWTRLEPQSVSGDPTPGLEARVHDPLWLLARQWQLGELEGADAGSPVSVAVTTTTSDVVAMQPGDPVASHPVRAGLVVDLLEPHVEGDRCAARRRLRQRAEAGAQLVSELRESAVPSE